MVETLQSVLDERGGVGYWLLCDGRFEVWDDGTGTAYVGPASFGGVVTADMPISRLVQVGTPIGAPAIGHVHGDAQPDQDETGYLESLPAFPGVFISDKGTGQIHVESIEALELVLSSLDTKRHP